eukprot:scaffold1307_cov200-Pinguiococcus_pyrenoidosus.AAC.49
MVPSENTSPILPGTKPLPLAKATISLSVLDSCPPYSWVGKSRICRPLPPYFSPSSTCSDVRVSLRGQARRETTPRPAPLIVAYSLFVWPQNDATLTSEGVLDVVEATRGEILDRYPVSLSILPAEPGCQEHLLATEEVVEEHPRAAHVAASGPAVDERVRWSLESRPHVREPAHLTYAAAVASMSAMPPTRNMPFAIIPSLWERFGFPRRLHPVWYNRRRHAPAKPSQLALPLPPHAYRRWQGNVRLFRGC